MRKPATKPRTTKAVAKRHRAHTNNDLAALGTSTNNGEPDVDVGSTTWAGTPDTTVSTRDLDQAMLASLAEIDPAVITSLTGKQALFVQGMLSGMNQTDAAKHAGYGAPTQAGHKVMRVEEISQIVLANRTSMFGAAKVAGGLTLGSHLMRLGHLSHAAEDAGEFGAAITAETNRGKASGLYVHKTAAEQAADEAGAATSVLKLKAMMDRVLKRGGK